MLWVGLTGGLGSGKSTVAKILSELGYTVIDADDLAKLSLARGQPGLAKVLARFGAGLLTKSGDLNRSALAEKVFSDPQALSDLEAIVHPAVREFCAQKRAEAESAGAWVCFYDVPLLFEKGMASQFDTVVVVDCPREEQIKRSMQRDGLTRDQVLMRMKNQMSLDEKARQANFVINNSGSIEGLTKQVKDLVEKLKGLSSQKT